MGIALAMSALLTHYAIRYAHRNDLFDQPGARRSHAAPTPRGGGVAIVTTIVVCGLLPSLAAISSDYPWPAWWLLPAIAAIAMVGWIDDHGGLDARLRFLVHCTAAMFTFAAPVILWAAFAAEPRSLPWQSVPLTITAVLIVSVGVVWSINLHNFMDGINGLLSLQAVFVLAALSCLFHVRHSDVLAGQMGIWIAAIAGFLPFNFPRARVFMGDVGSGVLGFLVAAAVVWQLCTPGIAPATGLILCSAFVTDASCTLISRMWRGRRWYSAHREHLYQWLVRCGNSHARVVGYYMGWNLLVVLPVIYWTNRTSQSPAGMPASTPPMLPSDLFALAAVYGLAIVVWWIGKQQCARRIRSRHRHAAA